MQAFRYLPYFLSLLLTSNSGTLISQPQEKVRLFVLTDIENEPDDAQSMVRLLCYANHFEIEGLVATTSIWMQNEVADWRIHEIVDAYEKVKDNLEVHESGYPAAADLRAVIKKGISQFGMAGVGAGKDTEGSDWLIEALEKEDPRPLWVSVWGGANVLAQSLWKLKRTKSQSELERIVERIRVYTISDQDNAGPWIRKNFPDLFYIVSPGFQENGGGQYHYATWSGISGDKFHGRFDGPDFTIVDNPWLDVHIRNDHGPLGAEHPHTEYLMEGDTPSFLGLVSNGLNDPEHPNYGGWGGRYELYIPPYRKYLHEPETRPIWTNTQDEVYSTLTKRHHTSNHATIWRWRQAYQHDFAARIDWSNSGEYSGANHPPVARLTHPNELTVRSGEELVLDASSSSDPDEDGLTSEWILYKEVGTLNADQLELIKKEEHRAAFKAPEVETAKTVHVIVAVTDDGTPSLTRYQRVIINVLPGETD